MIIFNEINRILVFVLEALIHVWPLLLVSIPLAVIIKELDLSEKVNVVFKRNIWVAIVLATLFGAVSPFCSCGVIPVISALLIAGVPIAPIMAFWLASPSMDPEIFFLSVGLLGWPLAAARIGATFLMSITGGIITQLLVGKYGSACFLKMNKYDAKPGVVSFAAAGVDSIALKTQVCGCSCEQDVPSGEDVHEDLVGTNSSEVLNRRQHLLYSIGSSTWFVVKFLLIAYVLEALIIFYVPTEAIAETFGDTPILSVVMAAFVGIPVYTTNLSALGLVGGLMEKGLSGGAGLAFLIGGATTTIPAMTAVYKLVDRRIFIIYIGSALGFAMVSGLIYNLIEILMV